jgi:hypothetical protein
VRLLALALALHSAEPPPVDVTWRGDEACPATHFHGRLAAYLADAEQQRPVRVVITVEQGKQWTADLALTSDGGRTDRRLTGNACNEVADAAAFVTAVAVDPGVLARPHPDEHDQPPLPEPTPDIIAVPPPAVVPEPPPPDPPVPAPAPIEPAEPRPAPRPRIGGFVRASGGFEALALPRIAPTASLTLGLLGQRWRVELGGTYRAPTAGQYRDDHRRHRRPAPPVDRRRARLRRPAPLGPRDPAVRRTRGWPGARPGDGYDGARPAGPWLALVVGPALTWAPRRRIALWLGVELGVPLIGGSFTSDGLGELYTIQSPRISLRAGLGVELRVF